MYTYLIDSFIFNISLLLIMLFDIIDEGKMKFGTYLSRKIISVFSLSGNKLYFKLLKYISFKIFYINKIV